MDCAGQVAQPQTCEALRHGSPICPGRRAEPALATEAPHHHHVGDGNGKTPVDFLSLGYVGDAVLVAAQGLAVDQDTPGAQGQQADQRPKERRFARAVGPDHCHLGAVRHLEGEVSQHRCTS